MEKLIYLLWKNPEQPVPAWRASLRGALGTQLLEAGALSLQCNVVDEDVATGEGLRIITWPPPDGFVVFWMHSANFRERCETLLRENHARIAGYLVTESVIQHGAAQRAVGERSQGFSLIGFLQKPNRLTEAEWHRIWLGDHTSVAVAMQASFRYVQNVVTRKLTDDAPALGALVEEGFATAALTSPHAFYGAEGDEEKYQRHLQRMMESCQRFIDFDELNSFPTSEYLVKET